MNRLTRISSILIQLQSKKIVTAKEIADHFEISLRTVYRDIKTLQNAGVPIGSENGVGYYIIDGYRLPPIALTNEEINALITSEQFINRQGDTSLSKNFESMLFKIKSVLKNFQRENVQVIEERTRNFVAGVVHESRWLSDIQNSIIGLKTISIKYHSLYKNQITTRSIEPMAVYFTNNSWVLIAFCQLRENLREFRLDRISSLTVTELPFKANIDFDLKKYCEDAPPS